MFFRSRFLLLKAFGKMYDFRRLSLVFAYVTTISEDFNSLGHSTTKISEDFHSLGHSTVSISEDFHSLEHSMATISEAFEHCYDNKSCFRSLSTPRTANASRDLSWRVGGTGALSLASCTHSRDRLCPPASLPLGPQPIID